MKVLQSLIIAMSMYSKIPMPRTTWEKENMKYVMCFFPLVGCVIGVCIYAIGKFLFSDACGSLLRGAVGTLLPILISGGIHMDGFMDTMDALSSYGTRERKLEILKDSHAGAFAILGACCYMVCSVAIWSEVEVQMLNSIACVYVISRALSAFSVVTFPAARADGLAQGFQESAKRNRVCISSTCYLLIMGVFLWMQGWKMLLGVGISVGITFFYYKKICDKQFGGVTGDLAGYFLVLSELAMITGIVICGGGLWN